MLKDFVNLKNKADDALNIDKEDNEKEKKCTKCAVCINRMEDQK